ncbi:MAG: hypothetical protein AAF218_01245 [Pseudomonadota bacterium]
MKRIIPLTLAMALGACSSLLTSTLGPLAEIDPLQADPNDVAVRIEAPEGLAIRPGSAILRLAAERDGVTDEGEFVLASEGDVWFVAPADRPKLRALQARIAAWEAEDPNGTEGELGISIDPCLTDGPVSLDGTGSIYLRTQAGGAFAPLIEDAPIRSIVDGTDLTACS